MKIAVSACLLGVACRFDGFSKPCPSVCSLGDKHELVPVCPEVAGGLAIPHPAHEIQVHKKGLCVLDKEGADNTQAFVLGAEKTLARMVAKGCQLAILKANSPSCGNGFIYDGTFSGVLVEGFGVTARLLRDRGLMVLDENQAQEYFSEEMSKNSQHFMYVLECADQTWYTGYSVNVEERVLTHNAGMGAKYTRARLPVRLIAQAEFSSKREAMQAEYYFKQLRRSQKEALLQRAQHERFERLLCQLIPSGLEDLLS